MPTSEKNEAKVCMATSAKDLRDHVMNVNIAKSEAEWWARAEIERLEALLATQPTQEAPSSDVVEAQWGGLARDIMMWLDMHPKTPRALFKHLESIGREIPQWLRDEPEMKVLDHVPSKGTRCVLIYKAMTEAALASQTQEAPGSDVEQAVQAAIDAGVAENGKYGVAAARVAARFILEQQRKDQTWSMIKDTTDNHDVALEARPAPSSDVVELLKEAREALWTFGCPETLEQLYEDDEEWAKFRFLVKDYRRAGKAIDRIDAALASTAGDTLKAENERLRAALERAEQDLSCRDGSGHYCPNCDRSGFDTLQAIRTALGSDQ